jgi:y4mF family transcriptional regulator
MNSHAITDTPTLGALVRDARKAAGLTQPDLALAAGTGTPFIVDLERGKSTIQLGKVLDVLRALGIELQAVGNVADPRG